MSTIPDTLSLYLFTLLGIDLKNPLRSFAGRFKRKTRYVAILATIFFVILIILARCANPLGEFINKVHFSNNTKTSGWIKTKIVNGQLFFPVTVNGHKVMAMLDSGTERTTVPKNLAKLLGLHAQGNLVFAGYGGRVHAHFGSPIDVKIGDMDYKLFNPIIEPFPSKVAQIIKLNYNFQFIILGEDAFLKTAVEINFPKNQIRFFHSMNLNNRLGGYRAPLKIIDNSLVSPVSIDDGPSGYFMIDTGDNGFCTLFSDNRATRKWIENTPSVQSSEKLDDYGMGAGGLTASKTVMVKKITVVGFPASNIRCALTAHAGNRPNAKLLGSLGIVILRLADIVFDYPDHEIFIKGEISHLTININLRQPKK